MFIDSNLATAIGIGAGLGKSGFDRDYLPGAPLGSGIAQYCYLAQPITLNRTGVRSFGGDDAGVVGGTADLAACCTTTGVAIGTCPAIK